MNYFICGSGYSVLGRQIKVWMHDNRIHKYVLDIAKQNRTMDKLNPQSGFVYTIQKSISWTMLLVCDAPMSEATFSRVHKSNFVQIFPTLLLAVVHRHELDKVIG